MAKNSGKFRLIAEKTPTDVTTEDLATLEALLEVMQVKLLLPSN